MNDLLHESNAFSSAPTLVPKMGFVPTDHYLLAELARAIEAAALKGMAVTVELMPESATAVILKKILIDLETGTFEALIDLGRGGPRYRVPPQCWDDLMDSDFPKRGQQLPRFSRMVAESRLVGVEFGSYENYRRRSPRGVRLRLPECRTDWEGGRCLSSLNPSNRCRTGRLGSGTGENTISVS